MIAFTHILQVYFTTWVPSQYKDRLSRHGITMLKIRRSRDRLIFNVGIIILVRRHLYIETAPCWQWNNSERWTNISHGSTIFIATLHIFHGASNGIYRAYSPFVMRPVFSYELAPHPTAYTLHFYTPTGAVHFRLGHIEARGHVRDDDFWLYGCITKGTSCLYSEKIPGIHCGK